MVDFQWVNVFRAVGKKTELRKVLADNELFKDLNTVELTFLESVINVRSYRPGEIIFKQGEVGVGMYIVLAGQVSVHVEEIIPKTLESKVSMVAQLEKGDFFGELALVEHEGRRSATATAQNETSLIGFYKPDLIEILERNPTTGVKILMRLAEVLGVRLKQTSARISELKKELGK